MKEPTKEGTLQSITIQIGATVIRPNPVPRRGPTGGGSAISSAPAGAPGSSESLLVIGQCHTIRSESNGTIGWTDRLGLYTAAALMAPSPPTTSCIMTTIRTPLQPMCHFPQELPQWMFKHTPVAPGASQCTSGMSPLQSQPPCQSQRNTGSMWQPCIPGNGHCWKDWNC